MLIDSCLCNKFPGINLSYLDPEAVKPCRWMPWPNSRTTVSGSAYSGGFHGTL